MTKLTSTFQQVTPHIAKLDLPVFGSIQVAVWLVRGDDGGWGVVDAGSPGQENYICEQILKFTGGAIPHTLILTHGHRDHGGAAQKMRDEWKVRIAAGRAEIPYLTGPDRYYKIPADNRLYGLLQLSQPPLIGRNVQLPLDEGMLIHGMEVINVPGHAPGMIALLHHADRALICGDVFITAKGKISDPATWFTYDRQQNRLSQVKVTERDFDHLLVSHGPPLMNSGHKEARTYAITRLK
jgi:glyoxylase-like metal-dependent hydrolase (beta-lactamase superfamily II)